MHIGEYLPGGSIALSPWFPRQADNAIFTVEIIQANAEATLLVEVFTKNTEDTGPGAEVGHGVDWLDVDGDSTFQAAQFVIVDGGPFPGFKEMVRFKYTVSAPVANLPVVDDVATLDVINIPFIRYRMLMPTWFDTAVA